VAATRKSTSVGPSKCGAVRGTNRTRSPFRATGEGLARTDRRGDKPRSSKVQAGEEGGGVGWERGGGEGGRGKEKKQ